MAGYFGQFDRNIPAWFSWGSVGRLVVVFKTNYNNNKIKANRVSRPCFDNLWRTQNFAKDRRSVSILIFSLGNYRKFRRDDGCLVFANLGQAAELRSL